MATLSNPLASHTSDNRQPVIAASLSDARMTLQSIKEQNDSFFIGLLASILIAGIAILAARYATDAVVEDSDMEARASLREGFKELAALKAGRISTTPRSTAIG